MTSKELIGLAERVEQATGADRELDALIAAALHVGTEHTWAENYPAWEGRDDGRVYLEKGGPSFSAPTYTASIDAAMTLRGDLSWLHPIADWTECSVRLVNSLRLTVAGDDHYSVATTMPLAMCAAWLKARARAQSIGGAVDG